MIRKWILRVRLNIKLSEIQDLATNGKVFSRGKAYFQNGYIRELTYDPEQQKITSHIIGDSGLDYYSVITVNPKHRPIHVECSCKAFKKYVGCCKHLIAALLMAQSVDFHTATVLPDPAERSVKESSDKETAAIPTNPKVYYPTSSGYAHVREGSLAFLRRLQATKGSAAQPLEESVNDQEPDEAESANQLSLSATMQLPSHSAEMTRLEFQINSAERTYKIKNLEQFLDAVLNATNLYFGKHLTYEPTHHYFSPSGQKMLDWMLNLYNNDLEKTPYTYQPACQIYKRQYMVLNSARLYEFLSDWRTGFSDFDLVVEENDGRINAARVEFGLPPVYFYLQPWIWQDQGESEYPCYSLSLFSEQEKAELLVYNAQTYSGGQQSSSVRLLSRDGRMLLFNQTIYLIADESFATERLFFTALAAQSGENRLIFQENDMPGLLNLYLPLAEHKSMLKLSPDLRKRIVQKDPVSKVFLDRSGKAVTAKIEFHYGDAVLNPHPEAEENGKREHVDPQWLIRDIAAERKIMDLISGAGFKERGRTRIRTGPMPGEQPTNFSTEAIYHLYNEAGIYHFLTEELKRLTELAEVYYSDQFNKINVLSMPKFSGNIRLNTGINLLEIDLDYGGLKPEEIQQIIQAYREKRSYTRLKNGDFIKIPQQDSSSGLALLETIDSWGAIYGTAEDNSGELTLPPYRALPLHSILTAQANDENLFSIDSAYKEMVETVTDPQRPEIELPENGRFTLRPYQELGFRWFATLSHYGFGGILADEMGLGKTLQMLTFIESFGREVHLPALAVVPTSLIYNWQREAAKFFPHMNVLVIEGTKFSRMEALRQIANYDLVVLSYAVARQDIRELKEIEFGICVLDEAQFIKNPLTQTARAVKRIRALRRFALTGTPIENTLSELWSIFDFLMPGFLFGHKHFQDNYEIPVIRDNDVSAMQKLRQLTAPFILRRMKKDVLKELPDKIETQLYCEMNAEQENLYRAYLAKARIQANELLAVKEGNLGQNQITVLSLLTRLRQLCCHPALFLENYDGGSGKLDNLNELLDRLFAEGHRVLLFSQFTGMLSIIRKALEEQGRSLFYIDGRVSATERLEQTERFNAGEGDLFLISLKAGGTGLNLTGADVVIHYDPWWNPAVEQQATDRAHRIGQENTVQVFRLITRNSIEEKIDELKERKSVLTEQILEVGDNPLSKLSRDELLSLFE